MKILESNDENIIFSGERKSKQLWLFGFGLLVFAASAFMGWQKLHYGFNFIDEGYHMTESWRLAAGDHPYQGKITGALRDFRLINAVLFRFFPEMTLLAFRKLQFFLTLLCLLFLSFSLYGPHKKYWFFYPLILTLFAFTGLDPIGMISNLSYYTYPHFFLVGHISLFLLGLHQKNPSIKRILYGLSGFCLWCISLSVLHLSTIVLSPVIFFLIAPRLQSPYKNFNLIDLFFIVAPFVLLWLIFIYYFNVPYINNLYNSSKLLLSTPNHSARSLIAVNLEICKYIGVTALFLLGTRIALNFSKIPAILLSLCILSIVILVIIVSSFGGLIHPVFSWFSHIMWFSSLLIVFCLFFWAFIFYRYIMHKTITLEDCIVIVLMVPCTVFGITSMTFSSLGSLTVLHAAIPATVSFSIFLLNVKRIAPRSNFIKGIILALVLAPFYLTTAWFDWQFTYFDVTPRQASVTIDKGFGKGIKTNPTYKKLYDWIFEISNKYTDENDYILSYVLSPMVHMIAKRRPAIEDSYISITVVPGEYYRTAVNHMIQSNRIPKIAFMFESIPALAPISLHEGRFEWFGKQIWFPSNDPISKYVLHEMKLLATFQLNERSIIRCYGSPPD